MHESGARQPLADGSVVGRSAVVGLPGITRMLRGVVCVAALALLLTSAARLVEWSLSQQVSFDGAMNLEVARSLAEGHGYRRLYADHGGFSHEIQTRAPFILPAAGVFAMFGVGIWQAQVVNLLYVLAFAALVFFATRRVAGPPWALLATAAALATPGIEVIGLYGYGELPALTWWLAGTLVLFGGEPSIARNRGRVFAAGFLIGIGVVTKTVLLIGLVACLPPYLLLLRAEHRPNAHLLRSLITLVIGVAVPLVMHEAWHAWSIGGVGAWKHWMREEIIAVHMQAGTHPAVHGVAQVFAKAHAHFAIVAGAMGLHAAVLAAAMLGIAILALVVTRNLKLSPARALVATLLIFASIYFAWWLLMTPTQKAWYRRIFNGVVIFEVVGVMLVARTWQWRARMSMPARVLVVLAIGSISLFYAQAWSVGLARDAWSPADAATRNATDARVLAGLPAGAHLYGIGWYSAPRVALYSGRPIEDMLRRTPAQLAADRSAFLVLDNDAQTTDVGGEWLRRYDGKLVADTSQFKLYRLDTSFVQPAFPGARTDPSSLRDEVDLRHIDYAHVEGVYDREGGGWRWSRPLASIRLHHGNEPSFVLHLYTANDDSYSTPGGLTIDASIDGCHLGSWRQAPGGGEAIARWSMAACAVAADSTVTVNLVADHVIEASHNRWLAYVVHSMGFVDTPATAN